MPEQSSFRKADLEVPEGFVTLLKTAAAILPSKSVYIGGGCLRDSYLAKQQEVPVDAKDIDVYLDTNRTESFPRVRSNFNKFFGRPVREHFGWFAGNRFPRGLLEYSIPTQWRASLGADSIQFNFGHRHAWPTYEVYLSQASLGLNQIAMAPSGDVYVSDQFITDVEKKQLAMNPNRKWALRDWERVNEKVDDMLMRPLFQGWVKSTAPKPAEPDNSAAPFFRGMFR